MSDVTGIFQEGLLTSEGIRFNLSYGIKDSSLTSCNFVTISDDIEKYTTKDSIGGLVAINGLHEFYSKQEVLSKSYSGRISDIIQQLVSSFNFSSFNVNDTGCDDTWYQPLMNQHDFIYEILLPNAFSNNSFDSPFFCFINSNNEFNLRNYYSMLTTSVKQNYKMVEYAKDVDLGIGFLFSIKRYKPGSLITKRYRNRDLYYRDRNSGEYIKDSDHIYSYPKQSKYLPIYQDFLTSSFNYENMLYKETDIGLQEAFNGRKINSSKDSLFLERFILTVPLNCNLHAGDLISLDLPLKNMESGSQKSLTYTDNYLIEATDHIWDGKTRMGQSQFLISRKSSSIPNNYLIRSNLMKGS